MEWQTLAESLSDINETTIIIDIFWGSTESINAAHQKVKSFANRRKGAVRLGIRTSVACIKKDEDIASTIIGLGGLIVIASEVALTEADCGLIADLSKRCEVLVEIRSLEEYEIVSKNTTPAGFIARGQECGGYCGHDSTFILLQQLLGINAQNIFAQGGISENTAAGCRAMGAAGVIISEEILLMPELGLPVEMRNLIRSMNGQESVLYAENGKQPVRLLTKKGSESHKKLMQAAIEHEDSTIKGEEDEKWANTIKLETSWDKTLQAAWPVGQGIGLAKGAWERYGFTRNLAKSIIHHTKRHVTRSKRREVLGSKSELAKSHGTAYPVVQGPMTRVSDTAEFAEAVARGGALPSIALAMMSGNDSEMLLDKTEKMLGNLPWCVGMLGFAPQKIRNDQIEAIKKHKPKLAIIAGGRPDQAAEFEEEGIGTYLHVPAPALLRLFIEQGARRFIFEGRECGGHVGPLSSFILWQGMIDVLISDYEESITSEIQILFAGGVHDALSAKFISAMAVELIDKGIKVGVLMGTAYLFTNEAVKCGAIIPEYQKAALNCTKTVNLETGLGHASRCAETPFAKEFLNTKVRLREECLDHDEIKDKLEDLTLGRLRLASKGIERQSKTEIKKMGAKEIIERGMVMIGQAAQLRSKVVSIEELHSEICEWQERSEEEFDNIGTRSNIVDNPDIAIVGLSTIVPGSASAGDFWTNIIKKGDYIKEVPIGRWDWNIYYDENKNSKDKVYSKWGGFIEDLEFDPIEYGIPPVALESIEPLQLLCLEAVKKALIDADYWDKDFDRENTSVILGVGGGLGDLGQQYATRSEIPRFVENVDERAWERLPEWTEESFPGILLNVIAGRVANRFNFGGINNTVDAACASSLAAIEQAVKELQNGSSSLVVTGGVDTIQTPFAYYCFSRSQALSATGKCKSFDRDADGIAISEGLAIIILKRLEDAIKDGDKIYCVIKGAAGSSDGKGLGMTAPSSQGQERALERAYRRAGFTPDRIQHYEAHGTGTPVGDKTELDTLMSILNRHNAKRNSCAIGSVKTMIGHTKSTAGAAGLVKTAMALHYKVLPPHNNVQNPIGEIDNYDSPVYLLSEAKPWFKYGNDTRKAGVSAFGFGGTNFHLAVEEYNEDKIASYGDIEWPVELLLVNGETEESLAANLNLIKNDIENNESDSVRSITYRWNKNIMEKKQLKHRVAIVAKSARDLYIKLSGTILHLNGGNSDLPEGVFMGSANDIERGKVVFLYPGQGSQYINMYREACLYLRELRTALEEMSNVSTDSSIGDVAEKIYTPTSFSEESSKVYKGELCRTDVAQTAIGAISLGLTDFLYRIGVKPDCIAGHSFGEISGLCIAGSIKRDDFLKIACVRGEVMHKSCNVKTGGMAAILGNDKTTEELVSLYEDIELANRNSQFQSVVAGSTEAIERITSLGSYKGNVIKRLDVSGPFHTQRMSEASREFEKMISKYKFCEPSIEITSNRTGGVFPNKARGLQKELAKSIISPVRFYDQIEYMYKGGSRIFIEVGPRDILTKLVGQILGGREHSAISLDWNQGSLQGLLEGIGRMYVLGLDINPYMLYEERRPRNVKKNTRRTDERTTTWILNGGSIRKSAGDQIKTGKIRALTQADRIKSSRGIIDWEKNDIPAGISLKEPSSNKPLSSLKMVDHPESHQDLVSESHLVPLQPQQVNKNIMEAYIAYQETMRTFLRMQERVMTTLLGGEVSNASSIVTNDKPSKLSKGIGASKSATYYDNEPRQYRVKDVNEERINDVKQEGAESLEENKQVESARVKEEAPIDQILALENYTDTLKKIIAERTGYPEEMIGLESDLEAELGIDSIKRVEILGALQNVVASGIREEISAKMEIFTKLRSISEIDNELVQVTQKSNANIAAVAQVHGGIKNKIIVSQDWESMNLLLEVVSDKTGYPIEMLDQNQDLEGDLGIDSIKRVEILGAIREKIPSYSQDVYSNHMNELTRCKTLKSLSDEIDNIVANNAKSLKEEDGLGK